MNIKDITIGLVVIASFGPTVYAQNGSLLHGGASAVNPAQAMLNPRQPQEMSAGQTQTMQPQALPYRADVRAPLASRDNVSLFYEPPAAMRTFQKNDIITIRVDEISRVQAEGNAENRRNTLYDTILKDWLRFDSFDTVKPAPQVDGDPRIQGSVNQLYRADASMESRESISFNIAASIVDIRPNGLLVLEAKKSIVVNENIFETSLSGICRADDIASDNVVLSRDLLDLQIHKLDRGRLRDGYKRGWFTKWFETLLPF